MFNQICGTAMVTKCALPYAYQGVTKLFMQKLPKYFYNEECLLIKEFFKRYMDGGFIFCSKYLDFNSFSICLNNLHTAMKYTFEKAKGIVRNSEYFQVINFLDVSVILHSDRTFATERYYKNTNAHHYLSYDSAHPDNSI